MEEMKYVERVKRELKMIFWVVVAIILVNVFFWEVLGGIFGQILFSIYTNDTNNTNEQVVDYDTYIQNTYNTNFNKNTQVVEKDYSDDYTITSDDLQFYQQNNNYIPAKANPFGN